MRVDRDNRIMLAFLALGALAVFVGLIGLGDFPGAWIAVLMLIPLIGLLIAFGAARDSDG